MEFDINIILVPVTLVFLLVYLADKFWLKQHQAVKQQNRQIAWAKTHLDKSEKEFKALLERLGHDQSPDEFIANEHTPSMLISANQTYIEAKRQLINVQGGVENKTIKENALVRWAYEYLPILLVIVLVRSFVIEPFNIPSSSMVPTLYTGDFIVVNKASYGLRLPITHTKILNTGSPKHGDVAVFRYPLNEKRYYIKRVIGLPNDTVSYNNGVLSINGQPVATDSVDYQMSDKLNAKLVPEFIENYHLSDDERARYGAEEEKHAHYYREKLGEHDYVVRYLGDLNSASMAEFLLQNSPQTATSGGTQWQITVPDGQYFVMGDNRDRSEDGRFWGFVPEENLAGRATYIWMHKEAGFKLPSFGRAGAID
ncbi:MAG: signal peptidase I [Moraxella sp.]|nr:signal peptidase I [Moraxella sp.]